MVQADEPVPIEVDWDEKWFYESKTTDYNHKIARIAVLLSEISYVHVEENPESNPMIETYRILGFKDNDIEWNYTLDYADSEIGNNQAAYSFACKDIKTGGGTKKLVFIVLRGTPLSANEWISNINVSDSTHKNVPVHEGFFKTAGKIKTKLLDFLQKKEIKASEAFFLITGHSRGASLANLLAATLDDEKIVTSEHLFVYTFAAPNVSQEEKTNDEKYNFIWNIVNAEDIIPSIPPNRGNWKWKKFGQTKVIANYWNTEPQTYMDDFVPRMNEYYTRLLLREYAPFKNGPFFQVQIARLLTGFYKNVENYYGKFFGLHGIAEKVFEKRFSARKNDSENSDEEENQPFLLKVLKKNMDENIDGGFDYAMNAFVDMHACETYLSWLLSLDENEVYSTLGSTQVTINGSYDCAVYDESGKMLARVLDGAIEINTVKTPAAAFPLLGKEVLGFAGNQNLNVVIHKGSLLPTVIACEVEHYDAAGTLLSSSKKTHIFPRQNRLIAFEAGKSTLESENLETRTMPPEEAKPLIKKYGLKQNLKFKIQPEFTVSLDKIFTLGFRTGTQEIYGTFVGEIHTNKSFGFSAGLGHQHSLYGRLYLDTEAFSRFVWTKIEDERKFNIVPEGRIALAYKPRRRFQIFTAGVFDFHIRDFNDEAFSPNARKKTLSEIQLGDKVELFPSIQFGVRF